MPQLRYLGCPSALICIGQQVFSSITRSEPRVHFQTKRGSTLTCVKTEGKKKKKGKPAFHTCTAGEDVHFLSSGPSCQTRGCVCPMPDSLGTARGLSRFSCPKAQLQNCNTTTTVSCTNSFRLNKPKSLDSHSSRGRRKKKKERKAMFY